MEDDVFSQAVRKEKASDYTFVNDVKATCVAEIMEVRGGSSGT